SGAPDCRPWPRVALAARQHRKIPPDRASPPPSADLIDRITNPPKLRGFWRLPDSGICSSKAVGVQECQLPVPIGYKAFGLDVHRATTSGIKPYKLYLTGPDQSSVVLEVTSRPLPVLAVSGRPSRASIKPSILCHNLSEAGTAPRIATINPYSVFAADCRRR